MEQKNTNRSKNLQQDYKSLGSLGQGSFSEVSKVENLKTKGIFCMKVVDIYNVWKKLKGMGKSQQQLKKIKQFLLHQNKIHHNHLNSHPNLLKCHNCYVDHEKETLIFITEYAKNGTLRDYMNKLRTDKKQHIHQLKNKPRYCNQILRSFLEVVKGVEHMHKNNKLHLDLKPENIYIFKKPNNTTLELKINEFSISRMLDLPKIEDNFANHFKYSAPEIVQNSNAYENTDIFSLASILFELLILEPAFKKMEDISQCQPNLSASNISEIHDIDPTILDLLLRCLGKIPQQRPNINELCQEIEKIILKKIIQIKGMEKECEYHRDMFDILEDNRKPMKEFQEHEFQCLIKFIAIKEDLVTGYIEPVKGYGSGCLVHIPNTIYEKTDYKDKLKKFIGEEEEEVERLAVITCSHNVYQDDQKTQDLKIFFRYVEGGGEVLTQLFYDNEDSIIMDKKYKSRRYQSASAGYDFAIIVLSKRSSEKMQIYEIKELGFRFLSQKELYDKVNSKKIKKTFAIVAGYPGEVFTKEQRKKEIFKVACYKSKDIFQSSIIKPNKAHKGIQLKQLDNERQVFRHTLHCSKGMSGSLIYFKDESNGCHYALGVHTGGCSDFEVYDKKLNKQRKPTEKEKKLLKKELPENSTIENITCNYATLITVGKIRQLLCHITNPNYKPIPGPLLPLAFHKSKPKQKPESKPNKTFEPKFDIYRAIENGHFTEEKNKFVKKVGSGVLCMLLYDNDTKVIVGCKDGRVRGFDLKDQKDEQEEKSLFTKKVHRDWIRDMKFFSFNNQEVIATASNDGTIKLLNFAKMIIMNDKEFDEKIENFGKTSNIDKESPIIRELKTENRVYSILFFPDEAKLVGGDDGNLRVFDLNNKDDTKGKRICKKEKFIFIEYICKICKIGNNKFAIGTSKGRILFFENFELEEGKTIEKAHSNIIYDLCYCKSKEFLISGSNDRTTKIWNLKNLSQKPIHVLNCGQFVYSTLLINSRILFTTGYYYYDFDDTVKSFLQFWDLDKEENVQNEKSLKKIYENEDIHPPSAGCQAITQDKKQLVIGNDCDNYIIAIYNFDQK